jgi:hypothetical protein
MVVTSYNKACRWCHFLSNVVYTFLTFEIMHISACKDNYVFLYSNVFTMIILIFFFKGFHNNINRLFFISLL